MPENKLKRKTLNEVCLLRLLLIVLLVLYHAFAPWCNGWREVPGAMNVPCAYRWIGWSAYSFMLECFTFISGWVFGYQVLHKGRHILAFKGLAISKFKRLIIPSIVFSLAYILLLNRAVLQQPLAALRSVIEGAGHMWYLPMLFWCFMGIVIIEKISAKACIKVLLLVGISVCSFLPLPLRMGSAMGFMVFFYCGYLFGGNVVSLTRYLNWPCIAATGSIYIIAFISLRGCAIPCLTDLNKLAGGGNLLYVSLLNVCKLTSSGLGVLFITMLVLRLVKEFNINLKGFWVNLSTYTFGIYLFQQFILQAIYYHSDLPMLIQASWLPWLAFLFTLMASFALTWCMKQGKSGRKLIG